MASYSAEEVQGVVDQLVRSTIRRPYDTLGTRRTDVTFTDIQESAGGVFLLYQGSPFYFAALSGQRLLEVLTGFTTARDNVLAALRVLRRRSLPVRDLSSLVNARVALSELGGVVTSKKPPRDITKVPSYQRFSANVDRFLAAVGPNIKQAGQIVQTPEEARKALPGLVKLMLSSFGEVLRRAGYLKEALRDYNSVGLPGLLAGGVVTRATAMLSARADQLAAMKEAERLTVIRQTVLELLGMKAVVTRFGSHGGLTSSGTATGILQPVSDADRPGSPGEILVPSAGGLVLVPGQDVPGSTNIMTLWVDGASTSGPPSVQLYLPSSQFPKIDGQQPGPFNIVAGVNNNLQVLLAGVTLVTIPLTPGTRTTAQVATELTTALIPQGFRAESFFSPLMFDGEVTSTITNNLGVAFGTFPPNSVNVGDEVDFYYGANAVTTRVVTAVLPSTAAPTNIVVNGAPLVVDTHNRIRYGAPTRRLRLTPVDRKAAVLGRLTIQLKMPTQLERDTGITFGMYGELIGRAAVTDAETIASYISSNSGSAQGFLTPSPVFTGTVTSDPSDQQGVLMVSTTGVLIDMAITVPSGMNAGKYFVAQVVSATKVKLRTGLPQYRDGFNVAISMEGVQIGFEYYRVASKSIALTSSMAGTCPRDGGNTTALLGPVAGTTRYCSFVGASQSVQVGDALELFTTSTAQPSRTLTVLRVFPDDVLELDGAIAMNVTWSLTAIALPFARLVVGHVADFEALSRAIGDLLLLPGASQHQYSVDLNRFLNPLLVNLNPTDQEIGAAEQRVLALNAIAVPLSAQLTGYQPPHVPEVDQLIRTFKEKGADRAVDILLECRFRDFFGLSQDGTSYSGAFQTAVRDVARLDLPVHKVNRLEASVQHLVSSSASTDYETEHPDLDTTPIIDPPAGIDQTVT
mgnify:CR=1 FL=1